MNFGLLRGDGDAGQNNVQHGRKERRSPAGREVCHGGTGLPRAVGTYRLAQNPACMYEYQNRPAAP